MDLSRLCGARIPHICHSPQNRFPLSTSPNNNCCHFDCSTVHLSIYFFSNKLCLSYQFCASRHGIFQVNRRFRGLLAFVSSPLYVFVSNCVWLCESSLIIHIQHDVFYSNIMLFNQTSRNQHYRRIRETIVPDGKIR